LRQAWQGSVLSIGNFDGVHLGHQKILGTVVEAARRAGAKPVVFTFDPHPEAILHPEHAPERILSCQRKLELLADLGIDVAICPDGPLAVLALSAEEFVRQIVVQGIGAALVVEGPNFVFGRYGSGDDALLRRLGAELGFALQVIPPVVVDGSDVSSTRIRQMLRAGRVAEADRLLGRPFEYVGQVVHGRHLGRKFGFPTANLQGGDFLIPADGVYAGWAYVTGHPGDLASRPWPAAISVGRAPTFEELPQPVVEVLLIGFEGELYGRTLCLRFIDRLREQKRFSSGEALAEQVHRDCQAARELLAGRKPGF